MHILSIDVGMKNLAYCHLSVDNNSINIISWKIINLINQEDKICQSIKKNNIRCCKKAKFFKYDCYYCKTHSKESSFKTPPPQLYLSKIKKYKLKELKNLSLEFDLSYNLMNKCKKKDYLNNILLDLSNNYLNQVIFKNTNEISLIDYGKNIKNMFFKEFDNITFDYILIENQIGPLALRMKVLQGMIIQHFIENYNKNIVIESINPINKLKEFIGDKQTSYKERKKMSIQYTRNILINEPHLNKWLSYFNKHSKKDDLGDCYLQARWYILKNILLQN